MAKDTYSESEVTVFHDKIVEYDVSEIWHEEASGLDEDLFHISATARIDTQFAWPRLVSVEITDHDEGEVYYLTRKQVGERVGGHIFELIETIFVRMSE